MHTEKPTVQTQSVPVQTQSNTISLQLLWFSLIFLFMLLLLTPVQAQTESEAMPLYLPLVGSRTKIVHVDFTVELPATAENTGSLYEIELERWDIPSNNSDPIKTTDNLQAAIDWALAEGYEQVRLPAGNYLVGKYGNDIYQAGIVLKSNMTFILDDQAVITMATNDKWNYCVLSITSVSNVTVRGGTLVGDRDSHIYTPRESDGSTTHDEGHLICIQGSDHVLVEDMHLTKANGDGILIVGKTVDGVPSSQHITIQNSNFDTNRRQGISIVGGVKIRIANNEIHHTKGTAPQFGVDLEGAGRENRDVHIVKNYFHNNHGGDVVNTDGRNVYIDDNVMEQGADSERYIDGPIVYWKNADQTIRYNKIQMTDFSYNVKAGIIGYSHTRPKTNPATSYIHDNVCDGCGFHMYESSDLDIRNNELIDGYISFRDYSNLTLIDNQVTNNSKCWAFRFSNVQGEASGNTFNGEPFHLPIQIPWTWCWQ